MAQYAASTSVDSGRSRNEIEATLHRYGAEDFAYATSKDRAMIGFVANGRQVKFMLPLPDRNSKQFTHHSRGARTASAAVEAYEQAVRQKWRALALMVKAKLEAVDSGIVTFEQEFLAHTVLPNGRTVFEETAPAIERAYVEGHMRPLMELGS
ncbi:hypothetical protein [Glaciibacter superstes]|uniref:hypothetical protein n=1 Tax=Glaciibacter superstes TaxID=501023 RepID=UPI0003B5DBDE|nr:hypothetical protein [Glaciibacter superstes]